MDPTYAGSAAAAAASAGDTEMQARSLGQEDPLK